jgi:hypothetical protein
MSHIAILACNHRRFATVSYGEWVALEAAFKRLPRGNGWRAVPAACRAEVAYTALIVCWAARLGRSTRQQVERAVTLGNSQIAHDVFSPRLASKVGAGGNHRS